VVPPLFDGCRSGVRGDPSLSPGNGG